MTAGGINELLSMFDYGAPLVLTNLVYMTRPPLPVLTYNRMATPFPNSVWTATLTTILVLACLMFVIHRVHTTTELKRFELVKKVRSQVNFFLFAFAKITEPDPLPWFQEWSSGKIATLSWSVLSTFMIFFYTSNLRAHLVMIDYEEPPKGVRDIHKRGERVYIHDVALKQRYK